MPEDRLEKIKGIFLEALELLPEERMPFLESACGEDRGLKEKVASLLSRHEKDSNFLEQPDWASILHSQGEKLSDNADLQPEDNLPFDRLGEFRLIRRLGGGGMGDVYLALQEPIHRKVTLKVIRTDRKGSIEVETRFWREVEAISKLSHPHIVTVHGSGEAQGIRYFAMEYLSGMDLDEKRRAAAAQQGTIPVREATGWVRDIARALSYAHASGIIHRDVKPSNIRITLDGQAKLMDFGVARLTKLSTLTLTGEFRGTPHYASPEQIKARSQPIDARTDVYSLGATLYEAVTGSPPFEGETTEQLFKQILDSDPVPPRRLNPALSKDLETVITKAMEKERSRRYQTMADLADDLDRFLKGEMIHARSAGLKTHLWKRVRRNPIMSASLGVALVAIVVFAVVVPWIIAQKEQENAVLLSIERDKALEAKRESDRRYDLIMRLADVKRLSDLEADGDAIWPAYPENISRFEDWLARADEVLGRLDVHRQTLASLRERALPHGDGELEKEGETYARGASLPALRDSRLKVEESSASLALDTASVRPGWTFEETETQWQHDMVAGLISGLEALSDKEKGLIESIEKRLAFAKTIEARSILEQESAWEEAIVSIADRNKCPQYDGLLIEPKIGFVPIGRDPDSGLWEFAHLQTGEIPERGSGGKLIRTEEMGLVFVLIPGGRFNMGAVTPREDHPLGSPNVDPEAEPNESPVHEVSLRPFLLSKYEMTQGQWLRFTDTRPSNYGTGYRLGDKQHTLLHPVEQVSWDDCAKVLYRLKIRFPSEAEWEYAARAGTTTVWWTGNEKQSLQGAANIADHSLKKHGGVPNWTYDDWMDDGYAAHAPVGSFLPNAFGLHDVAGNVCEWCRDVWGSYENASTDGSAKDQGSSYRILRGGSWHDSTFDCRSVNRHCNVGGIRDDDLGLRPAADW